MSIDKSTLWALRRSTVKIQRFYLGKDGEPNSCIGHGTGFLLRHPNGNDVIIITAKHTFLRNLKCPDIDNSVHTYRFDRNGIDGPYIKTDQELRWEIHLSHDIAIAKINASFGYLIDDALPFEILNNHCLMEKEEILDVQVVGYQKEPKVDTWGREGIADIGIISGKTMEPIHNIPHEKFFDYEQGILPYSPPSHFLINKESVGKPIVEGYSGGPVYMNDGKTLAGIVSGGHKFVDKNISCVRACLLRAWLLDLWGIDTEYNS